MDVKFNLYNISCKCHTRSCYKAKDMSSFWVFGESSIESILKLL